MQAKYSCTCKIKICLKKSIFLRGFYLVLKIDMVGKAERNREPVKYWERTELMIITNGIWRPSEISLKPMTCNTSLRPRSTSYYRRYSEFDIVDASQCCSSQWETGFSKRKWSGGIPRGTTSSYFFKGKMGIFVTRSNLPVTILSLSRTLPRAILFAQNFVGSAHCHCVERVSPPQCCCKIPLNLDLEDGGSNPTWQLMTSSLRVMSQLLPWP